MPRPKTACQDCGALCYSTRCKPCFSSYKNLKQLAKPKATESWWANVPRDQWKDRVQEQRPRMESGS